MRPLRGAIICAVAFHVKDVAYASAEERAALLICDGRGSAPHSQLGAQAAVRAFRDWLYTSEVYLRSGLDDAEMTPEAVCRFWQSIASSLYTALAQVQIRLVEQRGGRPRDYEFTAVAFIAGRNYAGWLTVGDSLLVVEQDGQLKAMGQEGAGEFANQTHFIRPVACGEEKLQCGVLPVVGLGLAAGFSDGTASRFYELKRGVPARAVAQLGAMLFAGDLSAADLHEMLTDRDWDAATGDDRSLALLARSDRVVIEAESTAPVEQTVDVSVAADLQVSATDHPEALPIAADAPQLSARICLWLLLAMGAGLDLGLLIGQLALRLQASVN